MISAEIRCSVSEHACFRAWQRFPRQFGNLSLEETTKVLAQMLRHATPYVPTRDGLRTVRNGYMVFVLGRNLHGHRHAVTVWDVRKPPSERS